MGRVLHKSGRNSGARKGRRARGAEKFSRSARARTGEKVHKSSRILHALLKKTCKTVPTFPHRLWHIAKPAGAAATCTRPTRSTTAARARTYAHHCLLARAGQLRRPVMHEIYRTRSRKWTFYVHVYTLESLLLVHMLPGFIGCVMDVEQGCHVYVGRY